DNNRVSVFTPDGTFLRKWSMPNPFGSPRGIAVGANDDVYVHDYSTHMILRFTSNGEFVTQWSTVGAVPEFGLAVDAAGYVYVTADDRIQVFTASGGYVRQWGSSGRRDGEFQNADGLAIDAAGNVYVADNGNDRIQKFTNAGTFLAKWGSSGTGDGQFRQ